MDRAPSRIKVLARGSVSAVTLAILGLVVLGVVGVEPSPLAAQSTSPAGASGGLTGESGGPPQIVRTVEVPRSIDPTGGTDVTEALNRFLGQVPNSTRVLLGVEAQYRLDGTITLVNRHDFEIVGRETVLQAVGQGDRNRSQFDVVGGARLAFRRIRIVGANPNGGVERNAYDSRLEGQHGIQLSGVTDAEIDHVEITDVYGDAVYVNNTKSALSDGVWIHDSTLLRTGRHGVGVTAARRVVIERNTISDIRWATVDLEPNTPTWGVTDVHIINNTAGPGRLLFVAVHGNGPVDRVVIAHNVLRGHPLAISVRPPAGARRTGFFIIGNVSDDVSAHTPMRVERVDGLVVKDNRQMIRDNAEPGVDADDVCHLAVEGNNFGAAKPLALVPATACPPATPLVEPPVPAVGGRGGPPVPPPSTTQVPTSTTPPAPVSDQGGGGSSSSWGVLAIMAVLLGAGVALIVGWRVRSRRSAGR